jgi:hypothetical protein
MKSNSNILLKIFATLLVVWICKSEMTNVESFEWYKLIKESNLIYKYIFNITQLKSKVCQRNFQNCVLSIDNNNDIIEFNTDVSLDKCFPFKKSSYCLQQKHYESYCPFQLISKQIDKYKVRLDKKIEICIQWYPFEINEVKKSKNENQLPSSSESIHVFKFSIFIPFLFPLYFLF